MDAFEFAAQLAKVIFVVGAVMTLAALLTWVERKQSAVMQDRIGANRAAIFGVRALGLFHIIADALKMLVKEDHVPASSNRLLHALGPVVAFIPALVTFAVIPFGDVLVLGDRVIPLQIADLNVGFLFILAVGSLSVYGIAFGGWASNNRYALLGSVRAAAQMFSYEIVLGLSIIGVAMVYSSISLSEIATRQGDLLFGWLPAWGVILQPFAFVLFLTAAVAETKRIPFDLPEGESEIIGFNVEYSGMKFGLFFLGDFVEIIVAAAFMTALFFGGWQVPCLFADGFHWPWGSVTPLPHALVVVFQVGAFFTKVAFFIWLQMLIRWTLPRFRYDQLMRLGWKYLLPLSLVNIFITAVVMLWV
jgi:NADH-quinone oxidoreductase subunit H